MSRLAGIVGIATHARAFAFTAMAVFAATTTFAASDTGVFVGLAKKVVPSVVNIATQVKVQRRFRGGGPMRQDEILRRFFEDFFRQYGEPREPEDRGEGEEGPGWEGQEADPPGLRTSSLGTGFVIDADGLILTNNHVVEGADEIKINFTEDTHEKPTDGEVIGRDTLLDLALIRVKTKRALVALPLGDSESLEVGEYVAAVGNPFGQGHSVTHGIISAKGRPTPASILGEYLQTDAPINPGNSGGPLVNLKAEVIGINNAIDQRAQGIGFAIPIHLVKAVLPQLKSKGKVTRGYMGANIEPLRADLAAKLGVDKSLEAPIVTHVVPGAPADRAGIRPYDVILEIAGKSVSGPSELIRVVTSLAVGETVKVRLLREGKEKSLSFTVAERPDRPAPGKRPDKTKPAPKGKPPVDTGMTLVELSEEIARDLGLDPAKSKGVVVESIQQGGAADRAGLLRGDLILEVEGKPIESEADFEARVSSPKSYLLRVRRGQGEREGYLVIVLDLKSSGR